MANARGGRGVDQGRSGYGIRRSRGVRKGGIQGVVAMRARGGRKEG